MASAIAHRGPDDSGVWCDPSAGLALAHQRLAILDLPQLATSRWPAPRGAM